MNPFTIVFIGHSGAGKGTQAKLLKNHIKGDTFHLESGARFREFIKGDSYSSQRSLDYYKQSILQPAFISVWVWADLLIANLKKDTHLFFDGVPRKLAEAQILETAFDFYNRDHITVIHLDVSSEESARRLRLRGRLDDKSEKDIAERIAWYEKEVVPIIEFYKNNPRARVIRINGEQTTEKIFEDICKELGV